MELLRVGTARSTWLFDMNELNPHGVRMFPSAIELLREYYQFEKVPASSYDVDEGKGLSFKNGSFKVTDGNSIQVELTIYADGIAANSYSSTRHTDDFIDNVLSLTTREFGLRYRPEMVRHKLPLSEITVRLDGSLAKLYPKLADFAAKISGFHKSIKTAFETGGISFWTDSSESNIKPAAFSIERKLGAPFSESRFFSKASLHTDDHLSLLVDFEKLLT
jgi:hypothetical protein